MRRLFTGTKLYTEDMGYRASLLFGANRPEKYEFYPNDPKNLFGKFGCYSQIRVAFSNER